MQHPKTKSTKPDVDLFGAEPLAGSGFEYEPAWQTRERKSATTRRTARSTAPAQTAFTVWVVSDYHPRSFDSRYFGPISKALIRHYLRPLLVLR